MSYFKSLETEYNGITFKNRLKARWAVYFDNVGIQYMYEPEGYVLSDGTAYLPDFYLPDFVCFAEVKGGPFKGKDMNKAEKLVADTHFPLAILKKDPALRNYQFLIPKESNKLGYTVKSINIVQDPNKKKGKFLTGFNLKGKEAYKHYGLIRAIKAVKVANNF